MLLRQRVTVITDHINLIHPSTKFSSGRVLRQRLTLEDYEVALKYIKGADNFAANALSKLPLTKTAEKQRGVQPLRGRSRVSD